MEAELMGTSEGRGGGSGDDYGERGRGSRSGIAGEGEGNGGQRQGGWKGGVGGGGAGLDGRQAQVVGLADDDAVARRVDVGGAGRR